MRSGRGNIQFMRLILLVLFVVLAAFAGLVAGTAIGAMYLVPEGRGLAAPADAMVFGLAGALTSAVIAVVIGWRASVKWLGGLVIVFTVAAALFAAWVFWQMPSDFGDENTEPPGPVTTISPTGGGAA